MIRGATVTVAALLFLAAAARADVAMAWSGAGGTIVVAHDSRIEGFDPSGETSLWSVKGPATPSSIVTSQDGKSAAILDGFGDRVAVVSLADGAVKLYGTPATPVAAAFFGRDLWVVLRDQSRVLRITPEGEKTEVGVALDPALVAVSDEFVYVYSRVRGLLQEIDPKSAEVTRSMFIGTAGSDLEIRPPHTGGSPGAVAFLCRPANGKIVAVDLEPMESREIDVGVAAIDLAFVPIGAKLFIDPGTSVIVDPGKQALFLSKNVGPGRVIRLPTAADRVMVTGAGLFAFDSNSGTVYRIEEQTVAKIASGLTATSFVATDEALFTWDAKAGKPRRETIVE